MKISYLISITVAFTLFVKTLGTCTYLSSEDELTTACYGAVDYEFYLPATTTLSALNLKATAELNNSNLAILPSDCKKSLKKLVCSSIYLKCTTGNTHIYTDIGKNISLPFERPCKSVCTDVNSKCFGLLNVFGLKQSCTAKFDYLFGHGIPGYYPYQYDQTNSLYCNNISSNFNVASSQEPYIYSDTNGACAGITKELYIPPSSTINSSFSPMLAPYTIQNIIEKSIASKLNDLPKWLGESCHFAMRKYLCGSYMLNPQLVAFESIITSFGPASAKVLTTLGSLGVNTTALSTFDFYLPSYPSFDVCYDFTSKCGYFLDKLGMTSLIPNCSVEVSSIHKFPNSTQTVKTLSFAGQSVPLETKPNTMTDSKDTTYKPSCPRGFVIPDDPDDSGITYVPGTYSACAVACKIPLFTPSEYDNFIRVSDVGSNIALPLVLFLIIIWMFDETRRKQYLVISFNLIALIITIQCVYMSSMTFEKKFCRNNAVGLSSRDGLTGCSVQSFFILYFILAEVLNWCLIAIDLYLKICLRYNTNNYYKYYFLIIFVLPIISVAVTAGKSMYGYYGNTFCLMSRNDANLAMLLFIWPIFVITVIGTITMLFVILKIYETTKNVKTSVQPKQRKSSSVVPVASVAQIYITKNIPASASMDSQGNQSSQIPESHSIDNNDNSSIIKDNDNKTDANAMEILSTDTEKLKQTVRNITKTNSTESKSSTKIPWKMIRTPLIFVVLYFGVWFSIFLLRFEVYYDRNIIQDSFTHWTKCAFTYYDGTNSWINNCGEHPKIRPSYSLTLWLCFIVNAHAIIVSGIFLLNPTIWFSYCDKINTYVRASSRINNRSPAQSVVTRRKTP